MTTKSPTQKQTFINNSLLMALNLKDFSNSKGKSYKNNRHRTNEKRNNSKSRTERGR